MALVHVRGWDSAAFQENPWFSALADVIAPFATHAAFPGLAELDRLLLERNAEAGLLPLRVVLCPPKLTHRKKRKVAVEVSSLYDVRITEHGELPTRVDDWHDFFNVLAFAAWPRSKQALHARQSRLMQARLTPGSRRLPGARTREQDALTLLDEGGVIVACEPSAFAELSQCTNELTGPLERCLAKGTSALVPFGHALFEHMIEGLPCPLAVPQLVELPAALPEGLALRTALDRALCEQLRSSAHFNAPHGLKGLALEARNNAV